ncbi:MAG: hypothetical protein L6R39_000860 [Caloplaca ligustica]|nr:MAG: hypothetical protein L6R39_000860 [Caloplaca ligustica]
MRMAPATAFAEKDIDVSQYAANLRKQYVDRELPFATHPAEGIEDIIPRGSNQSVPTGSPTTPTYTEPNAGLPTPEATTQEPRTGGVTDDLEGLTSQLHLTRIETAAPTTSRNVEVPKGFQLGMAFNMADFYNLRADFRRLDKRKRDLGVLPPSTSRQKHGFRPEELLWYGAIDLKDCKDSGLTIEIHPLLRRDCFDDTPDHIYDQLIPGLRLATLFLSHPACMQFWVTLAKGERRVDHEMSRRCGKTRHRISRNVPMTKENTTEVIEYMKKLGKAKAIHFTFTAGLAFEGDAAFGTARTVCDFQSSEDSAEGRRRHNLQCCNVRLHSDFYIIAKKLSTMVYPDPAQKLRFNFIFATLIVHELAHAIELSQWRNRAPSPYEPFLLHHNEAELGRMWESYMFGGQVAPINDRVDGIYGVATWEWPRSFGELDPERTICHALPMKYIEKLQQKETWERSYDPGDWRAFHVPRDGATSIYMNSVTTIPWTEEERVAKEALQEQRLQDLEEPARKKRETADGNGLAIKDVDAEPEAIKTLTPQKAKGTTAQEVNRVKREQRSVVSRKKRRAQKKSAQKASEKEHGKTEQPIDVKAEEVLPAVMEQSKEESVPKETTAADDESKIKSGDRDDATQEESNQKDCL